MEQPMFDKLITFAKPDSLSQVLVYVFMCVIICLFIKNKGKWQIGPISYEPTPEDKKFYGEFIEFTKKSEQCDKDILEQIKISIDDRKQIHDELKSISIDLESRKDDLIRLRKESIKTQILLDSTSYEQKLYLYDAYLELGGNGWMKEHMEKYKAEHRKNI
jgi:hypothetical protein